MTTAAHPPAAAPDPAEEAAFVPWTACLPFGAGFSAADLEHHAPLPRIGDAVEYIDERGGRHWFRVIEVVHTLQSAAGTRPTVGEGAGPSNSTPGDAGSGGPPVPSGRVRAGLPRVYLAAADPPRQGEMMSERKDRSEAGAGAYVGRKPEFAAETIPGGVQPDDERVAAGETQSRGAGAADERLQGRDDQPPHGHRDGPDASDAAVREAGKER